MQTANLGVRFLLELTALAILGYWGYRSGSSTNTKVGLAAGIPLVAALIWATFVAPNATVHLATPLHALLQVVVVGAAAAALASLHRTSLAAGYGATVIANAALMAAWGQ